MEIKDLEQIIRQLESRVHRLESLIKTSRIVNSKLELQDILDTFRDSATEIIKAQFCTIYLVDEEKDTLYSVSISDNRINNIELPMGEGISGYCAATGERVITNNPYEDERFTDTIDKKTGWHTDSLCTVPMKNYNDKIIGVIQLMNKQGGFTKDDALFLESLAVPTAIAVDNHNLHKLELDDKMLRKDMEIASEVQRMLLPGNFPQTDWLDASVLYKPYFNVSGDIYNFVKLNENTVGVAIGDVSGKGVSAALIMSIVTALFGSMSHSITSTKEMCGILNNTVSSFTRTKFCTFFYSLIHKTSNKLYYTNAGHNLPLLIKANGEAQFLKGGGPIFGVIKNSTYKQYEVDFEKGDFLLLYTDGLTESKNHQGEMFGDERLMEATLSCINKNGKDISKSVERSLNQFMGKNENQSDDYTIIGIKYS